MKVQTKITLLLLLVVVVFVAGLWVFRAVDQEKFRAIRADRLIEAKQSFEAFLVKDGEPLVTLADYDTTWDNMVQAIQTRNVKWLNENVSSETLLGYKAYAVWIFNREAALVYSRNAIPVDPELDKSALGNRSNIIPRSSDPARGLRSTLCQGVFGAFFRQNRRRTHGDPRGDRPWLERFGQAKSAAGLLICRTPLEPEAARGNGRCSRTPNSTSSSAAIPPREIVEDGQDRILRKR